MLSQLPSIKEAKPARSDERSRDRPLPSKEEKDFTPRYDFSGDEDSA